DLSARARRSRSCVMERRTPHPYGRRRRRWLRRALWLTLGVPVLLLLSAAAAWADDAGATTPSTLDWIKIEDSHGVSLWQYEMSLDRGGVTSPGKAVWAVFIDLGWGAYRLVVAIACWLVDWTLSFQWVEWLARPAIAMGDSMEAIVTRFGVTAGLLTITACFAVLWMMRGRWALGIFELGMALIIASLAAGVLSNPVRTIAGPDGLLMDARDAGLTMAVGLNSGGDVSGSSTELRREVVGMMADTFIRAPHQMINFGKLLDGTECADAYQDAVAAGPYGLEDDLRDAVGDCDEAAGKIAENPGPNMFTSVLAVGPSGSITILFAALLCGVVIVSGVYTLYQALKMIVALVFALLPGGARGSLWMTFAELIIAAVTIIFTVVFLAAYLLFIQEVFGDGQNPMRSFFIVDLMLLVGMIVFWKARGRIKRAADNLAAAMSKRPGGGGPTQLPAAGSRLPLADIYYGSKLAGKAMNKLGNRGGSPAPGRPRLPTPGAPQPQAATVPPGSPVPTPTAAGKELAPGSGKNSPGDPAEQTARAHPGSQHRPELATQRVRSRVSRLQGGGRGKLVRLAGTVAMAAATGGTSVAASTVTSAGTKTLASTARRAALKGTLNKALPPGPSSRQHATSRPTTSTSSSTTTTGGMSPRGSSSVTQALAASGPRPSTAPRGPVVVPGEVVPNKPERAASRPNAAASAPRPSQAVTEDPDQRAARLRGMLAARRSQAIALPPARRG
ncbi:MAG: hypothetical protein Q8Q29_11980, partial [Actinomycetota bacterium]|nr:hypothetical protein [Actinomycetota bacterium]